MKCFKVMSRSVRFSLLNALLVLVTALSVELVVTYVQLERQLEARYEHGKALAALLAETSEYAVFTRQTAMLERQIAELRKLPGVSFVQILDDKGQILAQMKSSADLSISAQPASTQTPITLWNWLQRVGAQQLEEIVLPIISGGFQDEEALFLESPAKPNVIGHVRLGINLSDFATSVRASLWLGLMVSVFILLIGFAISYALSAHLTQPLENLARAAHNVIAGQIEPVSLKSTDPEVQELGQAFNLMISWLRDYRAEVENYQAMLEHQAYYDDLTGLANRVLLKDHLKQALAHAEHRKTSIALLFLDLDRFKYVNDTLGHSFGDQLLKEVAQRLRNQVRAYDIVARMGGDEFILILIDLSIDKSEAKCEAQRVAEQISQELSLPFEIRGHDISTSFSVGVALCPYDGEDSETLIRNADCAMYAAKTQGRNTYRFYDPCMQQQGLRRLSLENGLKRALELGELVLHFQPKFDCNTRRLVGAEALLRWYFKDSWVSPMEFIPLAEETGLIIPIGEWVMRTALTTLSEWLALGIVDANFHVGVNVAPQQFWHPDFAKRTLEIFAATPGVLELELTESCLLRPNSEIQNTFSQLRQAGLRFAIDDFGTGYSSLSYLKQFPLDVLKIDQSFVRDCIDDPSDATIIRAIIAMAYGLGLEVIAEGVETLEHASFLKSEGCHLFQGYLIAKPMKSEDFVLFCQSFQGHMVNTL